MGKDMSKFNPRLRPEYQEEMKLLEAKMLESQAFSERFPEFSKNILSCKYTHEFTGEISSTYKGMYYPWGIKRWFYEKGSSISNYKGQFSPQYLWVLYINQSSLFGEYLSDSTYDLKECTKKCHVFFYDDLNSTFYLTDDQLIPALDALLVWYEKAKILSDIIRKENKKKELLAELERLS